MFCLKNALLIKASRDMVSLVDGLNYPVKRNWILTTDTSKSGKKKSEYKKNTITRLQKKIARGWISVSFKVYAFAAITLWTWLPWESVSRLCSTLRKM